MATNVTPWRLAGGAILAVAMAVAVAAYRPALEAGFFFDDKSNILDVEAIHWEEVSWTNLQSVARDALLPRRIVANVSFALNHVAGGLDPRGYHAVNIVLHLCVGAALFWTALVFARGSGATSAEARVRALPAAAAATAVFLVHPLATQAVTYVVQRMTSLAALFCLVSFGSYLTARQQPSGRRRTALFGLALASWLVAVGSKENALALPAVLLCWEICFQRGSWRRLGARRLALLGGLAVLLSVVFWFTVRGAPIRWLEPFPTRDYNGLESTLTQSRVQLFYLSLLAWPAPDRLSLDHEFTVSRSLLEPPTTLLAIAFWALFAASAVALARKRPRYGFPLLAYLLFHAIESSPIGLELVFEHRMYLPMVALVWLAAAAISDLPTKRSGAALGLLLAFVLPLSAATHRRNQTWSDWRAMLYDTAEKAPGKFRPHYNLGTRLGQAGDHEAAIRALGKALSIDPQSSEAHNQLGSTYWMMGRPQEAEAAYELAVRLGPANAEAHYNLAMALDRRGDYARAADLYRRFVEIAPPTLAAGREIAVRRLHELELSLRRPNG